MHLANQLHASLMFHTTGEAQKIVTNVGDSDGTEAWRRPIRRWESAKKLSELPRTSEKWEAMVRKQERDDSHRYNENGPLLNMSFADLARHLRINSHMYKSHDTMRKAIRQYVDSDPNKQKHRQHAHDDPREIGACHGNQEYEKDEEGDLSRLDKGKRKAKGKENLSGIRILRRNTGIAHSIVGREEGGNGARVNSLDDVKW